MGSFQPTPPPTNKGKVVSGKTKSPKSQPPSYYDDDPKEGMCSGYITSQSTHVDSIPAVQRPCLSGYDETPDIYRDVSCCSGNGAADLAYWNYGSSMFLFSWLNHYEFQSESARTCRAYSEMLNLILCDPNQAMYIDEDNRTLNLCLSTCQQVYNACKPVSNIQPVMSYPEFAHIDFTSPKTMCYSLWNGPRHNLSIPSSELYGCMQFSDYDTNTNDHEKKYRMNFICEKGLTLNVIMDDEGDTYSRCLSIAQPPRDFLNWHTMPHNTSFPNRCKNLLLEEPAGTGKLDNGIIFAICFISTIVCLCLLGTFLPCIYRRSNKWYPHPIVAEEVPDNEGRSTMFPIPTAPILSNEPQEQEIELPSSSVPYPTHDLVVDAVRVDSENEMRLANIRLPLNEKRIVD